MDNLYSEFYSQVPFLKSKTKTKQQEGRKSKEKAEEKE